MDLGFDRQKYIRLQSEHIIARRGDIGGKLYLEMGGKLFDDFHASRVLPGFDPDTKIAMLEQLRDELEILPCIGAKDLQRKKVRADLLALEVLGADAGQDLEFVAQLLEHGDLRVRVETGQHARGVEVVEELAAHLQVELSPDVPTAGDDVF